MIHVVASIGIKPGKRAEYIERLKEIVPTVLAEAGCVQYAPTVDTNSGIEAQWKDENIVTVIEKWETVEALNAHLATPHMAQFFSDTETLTDDLSLTVLEDA